MCTFTQCVIGFDRSHWHVAISRVTSMSIITRNAAVVLKIINIIIFFIIQRSGVFKISTQRGVNFS